MRISDWSSDVCSSDLLLLCLFGQRCACSICFRRDAELLHQCQRLIIHRGMVPDHLFCESPHGLVLGFRQSLFTSRDVDLPCGVCDVCDLGIVWMRPIMRSEEHTSELQSLMRISYAVFCLKKKKKTTLYTSDI